MIVNYLDKQFIIELKIWDGAKKHELAMEQLVGYMDRFQTNEGYLLTFDFRENKKISSKWLEKDGKRILDIVV